MVSSVFAHQLTVPAIFDSSHFAPTPPHFIGKVLRDETTEKSTFLSQARSTLITFHFFFRVFLGVAETIVC